MLSRTTCGAEANTSSSAADGAFGIWPITLGGVLGMHELVRALGSQVVDHGRERLEVDIDEIGGILRDVAVTGDDESNRVADEARLAHRQVVAAGSPGSRGPSSCTTARCTPPLRSEAVNTAWTP